MLNLANDTIELCCISLCIIGGGHEVEAHLQ
jgi:hypothetical protein